MRQQRLCFLATLAGLTLVAGCHSVQSVQSLQNTYHPKKLIAHRDTEYLHAEAVAPLKIPADMSPAPMEERYPTPSQTSPASVHALSLVPPGLNPG